MKNKKTWVVAVGLMLAAVLLALLVNSTEEVRVSDLPDGTSYRLAMTAYTNSFSYSQTGKPGWLKPFSPLIPDSLEKRFLEFGSTISLGNSPETNLMIVVESVNERHDPKSIDRLRIRDDEGNVFDGSQANGVMSSGGVRNSIYVARVLPKRSKNLQVELLVRSEETGWTNIGPFSVSNPEFKEYPQWTPEPLPQARTTNDLTAKLVRFESGPGSTSLVGDSATTEATPRSVRLGFEFTENGQPTGEHRVHWVSLADATGNKWSPHFDPIRATSSAWVTNGMVEFIGGVWPGEDAWKIQMESIRTTNFAPEEVWNVPPIALPAPSTHDVLTNEFVVGDTTNRIENILAPGVQTTNRWQWSVRYWGNEPSVYPVSLESLNIGRRRPIILEAKSENGADFEIISHQNVNYSMQSIFVQPPEGGAKELHLKIAFPAVKLFEFIARPEFVESASSK